MHCRKPLFFLFVWLDGFNLTFSPGTITQARKVRLKTEHYLELHLIILAWSLLNRSNG